MAAALLIVLREVIEAGLVVGIVLAASRGLPGRGRWVGLGVACGALGAATVAACAGRIAALFDGDGQALLNAAVLAAAVAMLTWHNVWMAGHGRALAGTLHQFGAAVRGGARAPAALALVCALAVLREGSEVALFLYGIATAGGSDGTGMLTGALLGLLGGAGMSMLAYFGLLAVPVHRLFAATASLITLLAAGMATQAIDFVQQAGYALIGTATVWNSSWLLDDAGLAGRLLHTLVGYTAQPSTAQLVVYLGTIGAIVMLMRMQRRHAAAS